MITWYDIFASIIFAYFILNLFFIPYIGLILSYFIYEMWLVYCKLRLTMQE